MKKQLSIHNKTVITVKGRGLSLNGMKDSFRKNIFVPLAVLIFSLLASSHVVFAESLDLVSRWNGDVVSEITAVDVQGGNSGTIFGGVTIVPGETGNAFKFDGSSGRITMGNPSSLNFGTGPFSLETKFMWDGGGSSVNNIIRKSNYGPGLGAGYWLRIARDAQVLEFSVGGTTSIEGQSFVTAPISPNVWHHVVATRDSSDDVTLYVDGESRGTVARQASEAESTSKSPFALGAWEDQKSEFFSGIIEEVSIYAGALNSSKVKAVVPTGYPVTNLGNCKNKEECRKICLTKYPTGCVYYYPELTTELLREVRGVLNNAAEVFAKEGGPGGCSTDEQCIKYCQIPGHPGEGITQECRDYYIGGPGGLLWHTNMDITGIAPRWDKIISAMITAMEKNIEPPAECRVTYYNNHLSCVVNCAEPTDAEGNPKERSESCTNFITETGYFSKDDLKLEAKLKELAQKGEKGGCEYSLFDCFDISGLNAPCAYSQDPVACFALADKYDLIPKKDIDLGKKVAPFLKDDQTPGKCTDIRECQAYCSIQANYNECTKFADKNNLAVEVPADQKDVLAAIQKGDAPGECKDEVSCRKYCGNTDNVGECADFAQKFDLATPGELEEMRKMAEAQKAGVSFPGNCKDKESCLTYCDNSAHQVECMEFAQKAGFIPEEDAEGVSNIVSYLKSGGKMPGGCTTRKSCDAYCESDTNINECMDFAVGAGFVPPEVAEIMKKTGGKGPGDCRSKSQCEAFCNNPANQTACMEFAVKAGIVSEEDAEFFKQNMAQNQGAQGEGFGGFDQMPKKMKECLNNKLGPGTAEKLTSKKVAPGKEMMHAMRLCAEEFQNSCPAFKNKQGPEKGSENQQVGPGTMDANSEKCFKEAFGDDVLEKMKSGDFCPPENMQELLMPCFQKNFGGQEGQRGQKGGQFPGSEFGGSGGQAGPGGCKNQEECTAYCKDHQEECQKFAPPGGAGILDAGECTKQGGTWNGTQCEFSAKGGSPGTLDECTKQGGTWNGTQCEFSARGAGAMTGDECTKQGGVWNGTQCDFSAKGNTQQGAATECTKQGGNWDGTKCNFLAPTSGSGDQSGIPQGYTSWEAFCKVQQGDSRCTAYKPDCSLFAQVPSCSYITDPQGNSFCKQCFPNK